MLGRWRTWRVHLDVFEDRLAMFTWVLGRWPPDVKLG